MEKQSKILVVDDDKDHVETVKTILESESYQVVAAYDENECIEKVKQENPDLILLDVMMDQIDGGFGVCQTLKNDPQYERIPILMLTGVTEATGFEFSPDTDQEFLPADDFVSKPVDPTDLLERVRRLLD